MMDDDGPAVVKKRSVLIAGHGTSVSMEDAFWVELKRMAKERGLSVNQLIAGIDETRTGSLSGSVRVFVLKNLIRDRDG